MEFFLQDCVWGEVGPYCLPPPLVLETSPHSAINPTTRTTQNPCNTKKSSSTKGTSSTHMLWLGTCQTCPKKFYVREKTD